MPIRLILDPGIFEVPLDNRIEYVHGRDVALAMPGLSRTKKDPQAKRSPGDLFGPDYSSSLVIMKSGFIVNLR